MKNIYIFILLLAVGGGVGLALSGANSILDDVGISPDTFGSISLVAIFIGLLLYVRKQKTNNLSEE